MYLTTLHTYNERKRHDTLGWVSLVRFDVRKTKVTKQIIVNVAYTSGGGVFTWDMLPQTFDSYKDAVAYIQDHVDVVDSRGNRVYHQYPIVNLVGKLLGHNC